ETVKALIRSGEWDLFGTQEGLIGQLRDLDALPEYDRVGVGRDDGAEAGEHSAIFYRKERFTLLDSGNFWLSETPDVPSYGWRARYRRICSWAKFHDKTTGEDLFFFSVHFDHEDPEARVESGKLMKKKISEIAGNAPVICTGDFNSTPETEQIQTIRTLLSDAYDISREPPAGPVSTYNGFRTDTLFAERIDYVFVSRHFRVKKYSVPTGQSDGRYPSDHFPVVVQVLW
ncbi:MAG TPA: endonuclease/exonuclease/phosphatase family protein, partial [Prolixibacteraceae bacterium]|nr:endonuclease/exonuclease/phosphatase family protein [Prolixibacteraceae bacterium]